MSLWGALAMVPVGTFPVYQLDQGQPFNLLANYNLIGAVGYLLWLVAYVLVIRQGKRDKTYAIPLLPICLNFTWEFMDSWVLPDPVSFWKWIDRAWFLLDVAILGQLLRYGRKEQVIPEMKRYFYPVVAVTLAPPARPLPLGRRPLEPARRHHIDHHLRGLEEPPVRALRQVPRPVEHLHPLPRRVRRRQREAPEHQADLRPVRGEEALARPHPRLLPRRHLQRIEGAEVVAERRRQVLRDRLVVEDQRVHHPLDRRDVLLRLLEEGGDRLIGQRVPTHSEGIQGGIVPAARGHRDRRYTGLRPQTEVIVPQTSRARHRTCPSRHIDSPLQTLRRPPTSSSAPAASIALNASPVRAQPPAPVSRGNNPDRRLRSQSHS